jgi:hypothetical protein
MHYTTARYPFPLPSRYPLPRYPVTPYPVLPRFPFFRPFSRSRFASAQTANSPAPAPATLRPLTHSEQRGPAKKWPSASARPQNRSSLRILAERRRHGNFQEASRRRKHSNGRCASGVRGRGGLRSRGAWLSQLDAAARDGFAGVNRRWAFCQNLGPAPCATSRTSATWRRKRRSLPTRARISRVPRRTVFRHPGERLTMGRRRMKNPEGQCVSAVQASVPTVDGHHGHLSAGE